MKIIYDNENNKAEFDLDRFYNSLNKYGQVTKDQITEEMKNWNYDPLHYSCLVEIGVKLLPDEKSAKAYYDDHKQEGHNFERLRRITGYLVGSLERWNDAKKAEERARVKHSINSAIDDEETQRIKLENSVMSQF